MLAIFFGRCGEATEEFLETQNELWLGSVHVLIHGSGLRFDFTFIHELSSFQAKLVNELKTPRSRHVLHQENQRSYSRRNGMLLQMNRSPHAEVNYDRLDSSHRSLSDSRWNNLIGCDQAEQAGALHLRPCSDRSVAL
ncbi:hypothetical protein [Bradyrhizobium sp. 199]|uniref:hypothetical protein n=1 Tax=Bradyrhizobium sp. 199 TaxID=2782664 RepID=UPI001FFB288C|nr:hypothetical protein [Bradyrhizobium sp. 199]